MTFKQWTPFLLISTLLASHSIYFGNRSRQLHTRRAHLLIHWMKDAALIHALRPTEPLPTIEHPNTLVLGYPTFSSTPHTSGEMYRDLLTYKPASTASGMGEETGGSTNGENRTDSAQGQNQTFRFLVLQGYFDAFSQLNLEEAHRWKNPRGYRWSTSPRWNLPIAL